MTRSLLHYLALALPQMFPTMLKPERLGNCEERVRSEEGRRQKT